MMPASGLAQANSAALERPNGNAPVGGPVSTCPLQSSELKRFALEVEIVGEDGKPLENVAVEVQKDPQQVLSDRTSSAGIARFEHLESGSYKICLPELDGEAWELASKTALPNDKANSSGDAAWAPALVGQGRGAEHELDFGPARAQEVGCAVQRRQVVCDLGRTAAR